MAASLQAWFMLAGALTARGHAAAPPAAPAGLGLAPLGLAPLGL
jgi:hypothetical protein